MFPAPTPSAHSAVIISALWSLTIHTLAVEGEVIDGRVVATKRNEWSSLVAAKRNEWSWGNCCFAMRGPAVAAAKRNEWH